MHFERTNDESHPFKVTFSADEAYVVRSAYREHIYYLAMKGNSGSMSDYEAEISGWSDDGEVKSLRPLSPSHIADVLDDFSDRTDEIITTIPEITGIAPYLSDDIGERIRLGKLAAGLSIELNNLQTEQTTQPPDLSDQISDDSIQRWLLGDS